MNKELLTQWLQEREMTYYLLASLYQATPASELLKTLSQNQILVSWCEEYVRIEEQEQLDLYAAVKGMQNELDSNSNNLASYLERLQSDFDRLFVGPGHLEAPPWESVYRSKERLVFGEQTVAVREIYRSFGLKSKKHHNEPDDHISLELEFMAWLCKQAADPHISVEDCILNISGQTRFLNEHLLEWVPALCNDIEKAAESEFFRGLAFLTTQWLKEDAVETESILKILVK
jgi:TorA maturation chaperone TorD